MLPLISRGQSQEASDARDHRESQKTRKERKRMAKRKREHEKARNLVMDRPEVDKKK